jgi:hypothetical protein
MLQHKENARGLAHVAAPTMLMALPFPTTVFRGKASKTSDELMGWCHSRNTMRPMAIVS